MSNPACKFDHVHIISEDPKAAANWYVEILGATIAANTMARGAPQIFVDLGGMTILILASGRARTPLPPDPFGNMPTILTITPGAPTISASCTNAISKNSAPSCAARE
jgi:catechol 2,3-dioxygenase-like lactoylglutathione lyase family enzyme